MNAELAELKITEAEVERLSGVDCTELFVGGMLGGVYRTSVFKSPKRLLLLVLTEGLATVLIFVFSIPIGLFLTGSSATGIKNLPEILHFLQITLGLTLISVIAWNLYMRVLIPRFKTLMNLLDEIDRYNEIVQAVNVLDQLEAVQSSQVALTNRQEVLDALSAARNSLISGLMTEKILRNSRGLISRRYELLANIENNLTTLRSLDLNHQATEYGQLLSEAFQIGMSVHQEFQRYSNSKES